MGRNSEEQEFLEYQEYLEWKRGRQRASRPKHGEYSGCFVFAMIVIFVIGFTYTIVLDRRAARGEITEAECAKIARCKQIYHSTPPNVAAELATRVAAEGW